METVGEKEKGKCKFEIYSKNEDETMRSGNVSFPRKTKQAAKKGRKIESDSDETWSDSESVDDADTDTDGSFVVKDDDDKFDP